MKIGISTASMYGKKYTEEALEYFSKNNVECAEVFLSSFSEYTKDFGKKLLDNKGNVEVCSIHALNSQFEGQLFSRSERQYADALEIFKGALKVGEMVSAKLYVLHGPQQMKYTKYVTNYEFFGQRTAELAKICCDYGLMLTWENVHWTHYNHSSFMQKLLPYCQEPIGCTLDIKQAAQSNETVDKYIFDMQGRIKNLHIVDFDQDGRLVLPCRGYYDYKELFNKMGKYDGSVMIEVYDGCYKHPEELIESYNEFVKKYKI